MQNLTYSTYLRIVDVLIRMQTRWSGWSFITFLSFDGTVMSWNDGIVLGLNLCGFFLFDSVSLGDRIWDFEGVLLYYLLFYYFKSVFTIGAAYFLEQFSWIWRGFKWRLSGCSRSVVIGIFVDRAFQIEFFMIFHFWKVRVVINRTTWL